MLFLDFKTDFDRSKWETILKDVKYLGIPMKLVILTEMIMNYQAAVISQDGISEEFENGIGGRQGHGLLLSKDNSIGIRACAFKYNI